MIGSTRSTRTSGPSTCNRCGPRPETFCPRLRSLPRCRGCGRGRRCVRSPREPATSSRSSVAVSAVCSPSPTLASPARPSRPRRCGERSRHSARTRALRSSPGVRDQVRARGQRRLDDGRRRRATCIPEISCSPQRWTFHDHTNDGDEPMIWFDGLDLPIIAALGASFFENHPDLNQPVRGFDLSEQMYGAGVAALRHDNDSPIRRCSSSGGSTVSASRQASHTLAADGEHRVRRPDLRSAALPTMSCVLHRVVPVGAPHRGERRAARSSSCITARGRA